MNAGRDMDKQWVAEHHEMIYDFEALTTDPDGLLGLLEDKLDCDDAYFVAKKLICVLFQV